MKRHKTPKIILITFALALMAGAPAAQAQDTSEEIRLLREQLLELAARLDRLEADNR